jgi:serine/threonine-protein kinase RsbT
VVPVNVEKFEALPIASDDDIVRVRQRVRDWALQLGFGLVDQTKLVTAASELARNTLVYGQGGTLLVEAVMNESKRGLRLTFEDRGPGIADVDQALKDGFTTGSGLGLGLSGARRLSQDFQITSKPGEGTRVVIGRWK